MKIPKKYIESPGGCSKICAFCKTLPRKFVMQCEKCHNYMNVCESCIDVMNRSMITTWNSKKEKYMVECDTCNRDKKIEICLEVNIKDK